VEHLHGADIEEVENSSEVLQLLRITIIGLSKGVRSVAILFNFLLLEEVRALDAFSNIRCMQE
jgi:hypothetical protein